MNARLIGGGIKVPRRLDLGSEGKAGIRNDSQVSCLNNWVLGGCLYKNDGNLGKKIDVRRGNQDLSLYTLRFRNLRDTNGNSTWNKKDS